MINFLESAISKLFHRNGACAVLRMTLCMVCITAAVPVHAGEYSRPLRVGLIEFSPLIDYKSGEPSGPLFDYAADILKAGGVPLQFHRVSIDRSIEDLRHNQLDLVLTLFKTLERRHFIHFSRQPLLAVNTGICTRTDVQDNPLTSDSRLVHIRGTVVPPVLRGTTLVPITGDNTQLRMLQMLIMSRVDAIFTPKPEIIQLTAYEERLNSQIHCYEIHGSRMPIHMGFSKGLPEGISRKIEAALHKKLRESDFDSYLVNRLQQAGVKSPRLTVITPAKLLARP